VTAGTIVIAIDGPAASGKSSTAHWVASSLGIRHIDSGALYRAATAVALQSGIPPEEWTAQSILGTAAPITLEPTETSFAPVAAGSLLGDWIRGPDVTRHVSRVASIPEVRLWVNAQVRIAAQGRSVVIDGRDIGTVVFPDADLKIFLVADPWERARRRLAQQHGRRATDEEIAEETERLVRRDARDATQTVQAKDSVLLDTTYLTQAEQVDRIVALAHAVTHRADETSGVDDLGQPG